MNIPIPLDAVPVPAQGQITVLGTPLQGKQVGPQVPLQKEQPEHRIMVVLRAQRKSVKEIAKLMNYSEVAVRNALHQPWAKELFVQIIKQNGENELKVRFELEAYESVETIAEIRDNPHAPSSVRAACAFHFLDRHLGKPVTKGELEVGPKDMSLEEIEERLARAQEKVARQLGVPIEKIVSQPQVKEITDGTRENT